MSQFRRVIEYLTTSNTAKYKDETLSKIITLTINELTKSNEQSPAIQKPALEILVGVGRNHCEKVSFHLIILVLIFQVHINTTRS